MMKVVFPIAGRGTRFAAKADMVPDYKLPKPLIPIRGEPMIVWALRSIGISADTLQYTAAIRPENIIFILLQEHEEDYALSDLLKKVVHPYIKTIPIPAVTRGALETALYAKPYLNNEPVIISDCDHYFDGTNVLNAIRDCGSSISGIIPVFRPPDTNPKWSYTLFDENRIALRVAEKDTDLAEKGAYANIGAYYFSSGMVFVEMAEKTIANNELVGPEGKREFYVAPLYQKYIDAGKSVKVAIIPQVWGLGTPTDAELFEKYGMNS